MAKQAKEKPQQEEAKSLKGAFLMRPTLLKKIKYIALVDDENQYDIVDAALSKHVAEWEKKNGEIKLK